MRRSCCFGGFAGFPGPARTSRPPRGERRHRGCAAARTVPPPKVSVDPRSFPQIVSASVRRLKRRGGPRGADSQPSQPCRARRGPRRFRPVRPHGFDTTDRRARADDIAVIHASGGRGHDHGSLERRRPAGGYQPARVLSRHEPAGTTHVLGLRHRLGARRHGLHDLPAGGRHHYRDVACRCRHGRARRHHHAVGLGHRRLDRGLHVRPHRPRADVADHHHLVRVLLAGLRLRAELRAVADRTHHSRPRLRRRMGRRRGADRRDHPSAVSRPRGRLGAVRLGGRLGSRC